MKKFYAITFLLIIGCSQTGFHIFSLGYRAYLQEEIREELLKHADRSSLLRIDYIEHAEEITWEEEGREFSFGGKMYDVAQTETVNGKVILYCADDEKETELLAQQSETIKKDHPFEKKSSHGSVKTIDFFHEEISRTPVLFSSVITLFFAAPSGPVTGETGVNSPPPKIS